MQYLYSPLLFFRSDKMLIIMKKSSVSTNTEYADRHVKCGSRPAVGWRKCYVNLSEARRMVETTLLREKLARMLDANKTRGN